MEINKYKEIVQKTAIYPNKVDNFGLAYCWLGLIGETEEVKNLNPNHLGLEEGIKDCYKEIGDVIWYSTAIANILNLNIDKILDLNRELLYDITIYTYTENIKKYYRDNKAINILEIEDILTSNLLDLALSRGLGRSDIPKILQMNYDKLMKRRETNTLSGDGSNREERK